MIDTTIVAIETIRASSSIQSQTPNMRGQLDPSTNGTGTQSFNSAPMEGNGFFLTGRIEIQTAMDGTQPVNRFLSSEPNGSSATV
jgi:hypothetical protein